MRPRIARVRQLNRTQFQFFLVPAFFPAPGKTVRSSGNSQITSNRVHSYTRRSRSASTKNFRFPAFFPAPGKTAFSL
jgi:hypothetical protein